MRHVPKHDLIEAVCEKVLRFRRIPVYSLLSYCYLCDWKSAIEYGSPMSSNDWRISENKIRNEPFEFAIYSHDRISCGASDLLGPISTARRLRARLSSNTRAERVLSDMVVRLSTQSDFNLERYVISTYPFRHSGDLDLVALGREFRSKFTTDYGEFIKERA